ncbi:hypothetical protein OAO42_01085 [Candidatus Izimaplasma bacterium]|nr:hypothetical protein [Candidatus Izimaplasma bacterium]
MKLLKSISLFLVIFILASCDSVTTTNDQNDIVDSIDNFVAVNELINAENDAKLSDVTEKNLYRHTDFFNYDDKYPRNVELEYKDYYESFDNLIIVSEVINNISGFELNEYFDNVFYESTVLVKYIGEDLYIDYYSQSDDLDTVYRELFILENREGKAYMERYSSIYDLNNNEIILQKKLVVYEGEYVESTEYMVALDTFAYTYNSLEDQIYFRYKMFYDDNPEYKRETVEYYVREHDSFVSYDIKDDLLEDYRVKLFRSGHRILKLDVNVFNTKDTISELTWNLLEVDGWDDVREVDGEYLVYKDGLQIMEDYEIEIQLNGYGKVIAYKQITGVIGNVDIMLSEYGLSSGINLAKALSAKDLFEQDYLDEVSSYGFTVGDLNNYDVIAEVFQEYVNSGMYEDHINKYN